MESCPCGSGRTFAECCEPFITGAALPDTAEQLMRSRYSAFATGAVDYIVETHDPETRDGVNRDEIEEWSTSSEWLGFELLETRAGESGDDEGVVGFIARYAQDGQTYEHGELSEFLRRDGRWFFHEAYPLKPEPIRRETPKVGRNEPCPCGSGKKYKKCHGAAEPAAV